MTMNQHNTVTIIGGGLAGCEAAWQAAKRGCTVGLYDMKPHRFSPAHESENLGELVCSNSFRSDDVNSAVGLLKHEMAMLDSLIVDTARKTAVPAGKALAVDREKFSLAITEAMRGHPLIQVVRAEIEELPAKFTTPTVLATGPLTSESMATSLTTLTGQEGLAFYDAIAPIVEADSLNMDVVYQKSRYDDGPGDYLNCPMTQSQYEMFIHAIKNGQCTPLHEFEKPQYFEGCLPIEVMCARGDDTLRFGPMKPVGLPLPQTGNDPYAVVQLRKENSAGTHYNLVGFQTKLKYSEQKRIFRMIPGMENAHFTRFGSVHRNTFINAPCFLQPTLQFNNHPNFFIAGQLIGVEGYIESSAMGLLAGINCARRLYGQELIVPPAESSLGALINHLTQTQPKRFQPSNINFGLFPPLKKKIPKKLRGSHRAILAVEALKTWMNDKNIEVNANP